MCGLLGMMSPFLTKGDQALFQTMLIAGHVRGTDGTGIAVVDSNYNTQIFKSQLPSYELVSSKSYQQWCSKSITNTVKVLMGHNRAATRGVVSNENSHPFIRDHIILSMNGTVTNQTLLPDHKKFTVDSDNVAHSIATIGIDETIKKLSGGFCLTYIDMKENTMNFIRNDGRPFTLIKSNSDWFWASEEKMLDWILSRRLSNLKIDKFVLEPNVLHTFDLTESSYQAPKLRKLEPYTVPVVTNRYHYDNEDYYHNYLGRWEIGNDFEDVTTEVKTEKPKNSIVPWKNKQKKEEVVVESEGMTKRMEKATNFLIKHNVGYQLGDRIDVYAYQFEPYNSTLVLPSDPNPAGRLIMCSSDDSYWIERHCVRKSEADHLMSCGELSAEIFSATEDGDGDLIMFVTDTQPRKKKA